MCIVVGPSVDPAAVTMVDSIKVYVKTKEAFGWPEDTEDFPETTTTKLTTSLTSNGMIAGDAENVISPLPLTSIDR